MPGYKKDNKLCCWEMAQVVGYMHTLQPVRRRRQRQPSRSSK